MTLTERLFPDRVTPGTLSTYRQRTRLLMEWYRVGRPVPLWVERAMKAKLPVQTAVL